MAKRKRITRKKLLKEPDEFITVSGRILQFIQVHKIQVIWITAVFFIGLTTFSIMAFFSAKAEKKAASVLAQSMEKYKGSLLSSGPEDAYRTVENDFQLLLDKYRGKKSAKFAGVIYANISFAAGDYDHAAQLYEEALKGFEDEPFFKHLILSNLGYCYEKKKDLKKAAAYFARIISAPDASIKDEALFNLGGVYAEMEEISKSSDAYNKIISDYADSIYLDIVKEKMSG